jgi:hypothetical protein
MTDIFKVKDKSWQKTVSELLNEIRNSGYNTMKKWFLKPELVNIAQDRDIPAEVVEDKGTPGWSGKPKGLRQVLVDMGCWINPDVPLK